MDAQTRDPSEADRHLSFTTKDVRVKSDGDDDSNSTIEVPVSGLAEDRDGDKLADGAIESMVAQINDSGIPMFPNHGYDADNGVPQAYRFEDIIGGWTSAERDGDTVVATAELREGSPSVAALKDLFEQGLPVGFSIGFGWSEADAEERDAGGMRFHDLDLMEISPVGIQSHPDAQTSDGLKLASAASKAGLDPATLTAAIKDAMSDDNTKDDEDEEEEQDAKEDSEDEEEEEEQEESEGEAKDETEGKDVEEALQTVMGILEAHHEAALEDIRTELDVSEADDAETEASDEDGEEEETEASDDDDEEEDKEKAAELREELEAVKAEMEAMKTDAAGSSGPKGGIRTTDGDTKDGDTSDGDAQESEEQADKDGTVTREFAESLV